MATATGVKGRVEVVPTDTDYTVLIDYAHSPDGVENVLKAVRGFAKGRVVALFGCGGDRDRTKRPKMGKIAADLADFCVVTSDNPRTEQPQAIIDDILEGMKDSKTPMQVIVDRPEAIHWALAHAQKDDIIVLHGQGTRDLSGSKPCEASHGRTRDRRATTSLDRGLQKSPVYGERFPRKPPSETRMTPPRAAESGNENRGTRPRFS